MSKRIASDARLRHVLGQIREAERILEDGTEYEKLHVPAILRDADRTLSLVTLG